MGKKGRKTRWRKLPIPIGNGGQRQEDEEDTTPTSPPAPSRTTFNEDEYTKITTPRQDMLFKKGYLGRKKSTPTPSQDTADAQSAESVESEQYCCEEAMPPYMYPAPAGYIDPSGIYYVNSMYPQGISNYEVYDPYTGGVTVVVGPAPQFGGPHPVLAALPCTPVPLQSVEWFAPPPPPHTLPQYNHRKKSPTSPDSQNWSGQSSETTCPPGSPQEPIDQPEAQPYVYPGYMFGPPVYNINGVNVQTVLPPAAPTPCDQSKRRKKRRRRRRGGVTDDGSESSCEEVCSLEAAGSSASSSKTNSDSGIATDPCGASGGQGSLSSLSNDEADKDNKSLPSEANSPTVEDKDEIPLKKAVEEPVISGESEPVLENETEVHIEEVHSDELNPAEVITDEVKSAEVITDEVKPTEVITDEVNSAEVTADEVITDEVKSAAVITDEVKSAAVITDEVKLTEVATDEVKTALAHKDELNSTVVGSDEVDSAIIQNEVQKDEVPLAESITPQLSEKQPETSTEVGIEQTSESTEDTEAIIPQENIEETTEKSESTYLTHPEEECTAEAFSDDEFEEKENACSSDESTVPCTADDHSIDESQTDVEPLHRISFDSVESRLQDEENLEEDKIITGFNDLGMYDLDHLELEPLPEPPPVAPPRRKKCAKVAEKLATKLADEIVTNAVSSAAEQRWPITSAVTKWLEDSEDEVEEAEEALTGQKNGEGNPFLAPSRSGSRTRVASAESYNSRVRDMCDPIASVNKYYRLALPIKTGPGPFPCGVCCIIQ